MSELHIDFETRSTVDLKKTGVYPYAKHPTTDIWCMAWAFDHEKPVIWTPNDRGEKRVPSSPSLVATYGELPLRVSEHIREGGTLVAHNAQFERIIWREIMVKRYGAPEVKLEQWRCTAAEAAAMQLPRALGQLTAVLNLDVQKDAEGAALMLRMCKPRKVNDDGSIVWWDVPERIARLCAYCITDVESEQAASKCLRPLDPGERKLYLLDQKINDRGIGLDKDLIEAMQEVADEGVDRANTQLTELTGGHVSAVTNNGRLRAWLNENGVETDSVAKDAVQEMLGADLTPKVRQVLNLRADAGRSSLAKLKAMVKCADPDDYRVRGTLLFCGAGTRRWTAKLIQPQNFPRGTVDNIEWYINMVMERAYDKLNLFYHPLEILSSMLRSCLCAAPGKVLVAADYSGIEMRVLNWLAGQEDVLQMLRDGLDPYRVNAARFFHLEYAKVGKSSIERQTGKFQELGCGFQMGHVRAREAADTPMYGNLKLSEDEAKSLVDDYRNSHDRVVAYWRAAEDAVMQATRKPGVPVAFGPEGRKVKALVAGAYLYLILPSKGILMFPSPRIESIETPWSTKEKPAFRDAVVVSGVDSFSKKWTRSGLYGGLIVENIVQSLSRDLMAEGMIRVESRGFPVVLCVHDEIVSEVDAVLQHHDAVKDYESMLCELPAWAEGLPVKAEGWVGKRYRK